MDAVERSQLRVVEGTRASLLRRPGGWGGHGHPVLVQGAGEGCCAVVPVKVLPWVVEGAAGLWAGKTSGAGTRGVDLNAAVGGRTGYTDTNGGESSNNGSKIHADCYPAQKSQSMKKIDADYPKYI